MPTVGVVSVDAGVEEIVGLPFPRGMAGVVRVCFWVPGPPPHSGFHCGAVPMPMRSTRDVLLWVLRARVVRGGLRTG